MKKAALFMPIPLILFGLARVGGAKSSTCQASGTTRLPVCSKPSSSCNRPYKTFAPYELGLRLPQKIKPNIAYKSVTFYAVVLKTAPAGTEPDCDQGEFSSAWENERKRVQKLFPQRKVFADHQCPDMAAVSYIMEGKPSMRPFIAIYAGGTPQESGTVLRTIKSKYKTAKVKVMQVVFEQIMQ